MNAQEASVHSKTRSALAFYQQSRSVFAVVRGEALSGAGSA